MDSHCLMVVCVICILSPLVLSQDVPVSCGGFIKSDFPVDFTRIQIKLYTASGSLRDSTDCAPINGYFLLPLYERGEFLIKVDAPEGWSTEPSEVSVFIDGETDRCSRGEDINFQLLGFSVYGQVVSYGLKVGPSGVSLQLEQDGSIVQSTTSVAQGRFVIEGVAPGRYMLQASHTIWSIPKSDLSVEVTDGSVEVPANTLFVLGYDVRGRVASDGEAIPGVKFFLYPESDLEIECDRAVAGDGGTSRSPTCVSVSDNSGEFVFPHLPPGQYTLVPYYRQNEIDFEVHPTETGFVVFNDTVVLEPTFEVHGFSVSGQVLRTKKGEGIHGAKVYIDGEEIASTNEHGQYQLLNVTTGKYSIKVESSGVEFEEVIVHLSPSNPSIPVIIPSRYSVCGDITISLPPSPAISASFREVNVLSATSSTPTVVETERTTANGEFCVMLPLGEYKVKVVVSADEAAHGLMVLPSEHFVAMVEEPISTRIKFKQFLATLAGSITCIGKCIKDIEVTLNQLGLGDKGQKLRVKINNKGNTGSFTFKDVLPGNVKVSIVYPHWCWNVVSLNVEVVTGKQPEVTFDQTGYSMQYTVSHDTPVSYYVGNGSVVDVVLSGSGKKCLDKPGVYTIHPKSCHKFQQDVYKFDTSSPKPLVLTADGHYVNVSVLTEKEDKQLTIRIRSLRFGSEEQVLKPMGFKKTFDKWEYSFSFLARSLDEVDITPLSTELMFSPRTRVATISNDCPEEVSAFIGSPGLMVIGRIEPPLEGVTVTIQTEEEGVIAVTTNNQGQYRAGPLRGGKQLSVTAELDGYTFEPFQDDPQSFKALKLSKILIKVMSSSGSVLPSVLVSLSGANFRSNNFTNYQGTLEYHRLNPGQYFLKALLREYEFKPTSKVIDLVQGQSEEIVFNGTRVAFSCSGIVTTLNRQPLEGVLVTASGSGSLEQCTSFNGEAVTDSSGGYRLRGLMPGCEYTVSVVPEGSGIQRTLPNSKIITVTDHDVEDVVFIAVLMTTQIFITGNVITKPEHLGLLKAQLLSGTKSGLVISSIGIDTAGFFDFPPVPVEKESNYIVSLESNLSPYTYNFSHEEKVIPGDRDSHLTLTFSAEEITVGHDSQRGSIVALIIAVLIIFALVNIEKVFVFVQSSITNFGTNNTDSNNSGTDNRRKAGRRR